MPSRIRTILIDDSAFMRKMIGDIIRTDESIELVGVATDGKQGSDMTLDLKPDVIVTDMIMPDYDGMYVVNSVMERLPTPIILLSTLEKSSSRIFDALQGGAFEFIDKPQDISNFSQSEYRLLELIKQASKTDVSLLKERQLSQKNNHSHSFQETLEYEIIAIGASTGGPSAIESIVTNLPENLSIPVIIVQHMPARFLETFSKRLDEVTPLQVKLASRGEALKGGKVYLAPGDTNTGIGLNMITGSPMVTFTKKRYPFYNDPSVDCLFESVASNFGKRSIGVILTGMGKDGTYGLKKINDAGGITIAQDEESSVVYGMPQSAVQEGAAKYVVSLKQIPGFIISCL